MNWILPEGDTHFAGAAQSGEYMPDLYRSAIRHVRKLRTAIDIGAHVGFYTAKMAENFRTVWAFEPVPDNYECLIRNVPADVIAKPVALGNGAGKAIFRQPNEKNSGSWERGETGPLRVPMLRLDDFLISEIDFIKIDVQGMEVEVLDGARRLIGRDLPVIAVETRLRGTINDEIESLLTSWGATVLERLKNDIVMGWR